MLHAVTVITCLRRGGTLAEANFLKVVIVGNFSKRIYRVTAGNRTCNTKTEVTKQVRLLLKSVTKE